MRVYIAAPYPERDAARLLMAELERAGFEVTSTWLREEDELADKFARLDLADVDRADVLVAINPPTYLKAGTGGRHVELGYALALHKPIVLVGERSNIFHFLDNVQVAPLEAVIPTLRRVDATRRPASAVDRAVGLVVAELRRAEAKHKPLNSLHEGYAVILEELDELWADVKADRKEAALREAVQVAAMGLRFLVNLSPVEKGGEVE
jgi:nucleoside 2-deoxyribosyltransferase